MFKSFSSGAASEILLWPRFYFWIPVVIALLSFSITAFCLLVASGKAMFKSFDSGAASEILLWPRFYFWIPVVIALLSFSITAFCLLVAGRSDPDTSPSNGGDTNSIEAVEKHEKDA